MLCLRNKKKNNQLCPLIWRPDLVKSLHAFMSSILKCHTNSSVDQNGNLQYAQSHQGMHRSNLIMNCLFDLILYIQVNNFSVMLDGSSWVEPILSKD